MALPVELNTMLSMDEDLVSSPKGALIQVFEDRVAIANMDRETRLEKKKFDADLELEPFVEPFEFDVSEHFTTDMVFKERSDLLQWARDVARGHGVVLTTQKSDGLNSRSCPRIFLGCDRSGDYRERQASIDRRSKRVRRTTTKRCGCPFSLKGYKVRGRDEWRLEVISGIHNHRGSLYLEEHPFAGKLKPDQKEILKEMSQVGIKPRDVLQTLKQRDPTNVTTIKTIYNARAALRVQELDGRTPIQHLFKCLDDLGYVTFYRTEENTNRLTDLFFAHPTSIDLSIAFPSVFLIDCTNKKNQFHLPLVSIIGVTSTDKYFFSAFAFLSSEEESNYTWALECFKSIFNSSTLPLVVVTDCELALIVAIQIVFPSTKNLLCLGHISKDVEANCKKYFAEEENFEKFMRDWHAITHSSTETDYHEAFLELNKDFSFYPEVLSYVSQTWLIPYKEFFVAAWTNQHMHLGNTSTSQVESVQTQLKKYLQVSASKLTTAWTSFDSLINQQHADVKSSFSANRLKMHCTYNQYFYSELYGFVSNYALAKINEQKEIAESNPEDVIIDAQKCQHAIRRSFGIPCAHELVSYLVKGAALPKSMIHDHWTRLSMSVGDSNIDLFKDIMPDFVMIKARYSKANANQKAKIKQKLHEIADPSAAQLKESLISIKPRGRPKGSTKLLAKGDKTVECEPSAFECVEKLPSKRGKKSKLGMSFHEIIRCLPVSMSGFIRDATDVARDGHCGFRAVAELLGMGLEGWRQVRKDLAYELQRHNADYAQIFGDLERIGELAKSLQYEEVPAPPEFWMSMPDMGHLIASFYDVVLILISKEQCLTFLPMRSPPPATHRLIAIGYIDRNHYVQLHMVENPPIPPIACNWIRYHAPAAEDWQTPYIPRIIFMEKVIEPEIVVRETPEDMICL